MQITQYKTTWDHFSCFNSWSVTTLFNTNEDLYMCQKIFRINIFILLKDYYRDLFLTSLLTEQRSMFLWPLMAFDLNIPVY